MQSCITSQTYKPWQRFYGPLATIRTRRSSQMRSMGATHAEKSTSKTGALNAVPADGGMAASGAASTTEEPKFCAIDDPTCEACQ